MTLTRAYARPSLVALFACAFVGIGVLGAWRYFENYCRLSLMARARTSSALTPYRFACMARPTR